MDKTTGRFELDEVVFSRRDGFLIGRGWWTGAGDPRYCLAMRWSESACPPTGYPAEQWFALPGDVSLQVAEMLGAWRPSAVRAEALAAAVAALKKKAA